MNSSRYKDINLHESGIAIVGMSGRFPGAKTIAEFWENLCEGKIALRNYTRQEVNEAVAAHDSTSIPHLMKQVNSGTWVSAGFHLDDPDKFDAEFFGYTPSEAELLDPQQRIFLEAAWAAVEDAGYVPDEYPGTVGIFGGANLSRYFLYNIFSNREIMYSSRDLTAGIGNEPDYVTNRVAYKLNFTGPSVSVQTACSTSLVAIHMASQALLAGECDFCLAGGVMVNAPGSAGYLYQEGSMTSPDGQIRTFDQDAAGTVFSEGGVGVVCLKRIEDAINDGDHIYGVLIGSAVGNDGIHKAGYTAPGVDGQVSVIAEALQVADVSPRDISYVEAHGTGTPLGDPIEVNALTKAYRNHTSDNQYCAIGSLKPNVGHLAPAAGVASVIKASLALKNKMLPPSVNYQTPNPKIDFSSSPFYVNTRLTPWDARNRIAAVSSFGIGGTNAHLILTEAPEETLRDIPDPHTILIPISAKTNNALNSYLNNLGSFIKRNPHVNLRDVAYTLRVGRKQFKRRICIAANSVESLVMEIENISGANTDKATLDAQEKIVYMFSGQGSQYLQMCRDLYRDNSAEFAVFRTTLEDCFNRFSKLSGVRLRDIVFSSTEESAAELRETSIVQPLLFSFELALAKQLHAFNIPTSAMIGHSIGEYVAAHLAGVFDLDSAVWLVQKRGELMQSMPAGAMLSLPLAGDIALQYVTSEISFAADNGPEHSVLAGNIAAIEALADQLVNGGINARKLVTSHAFHSYMMNPILDEFQQLVSQVSLHNPHTAYISNVTGTWITDGEATNPAYWAKHLAGTVNFRAGIETLLQDGYRCFIEVGPGNALSTFTKRISTQLKQEAKAFQLVRHAKEIASDSFYFRNSLKKLWCAGLSLDWALISPVENARKIPLPTYAFERTRHWVDARKATDNGAVLQGKREDLSSWMYVPSWKRQARLAKPDFSSLRERKVLLLARQAPLALITALAEHCKYVVIASQGSSFEQLSPSEFKLDLNRQEHVERLLENIDIDTVLHTPCLDRSIGSTLELCEHQLTNAFYSLLFLYQALGQYSGTNELVLLSLSTGLHDVLPLDEIDPTKAVLQGVHLCAGQEYPTIKAKNLDVSGDSLLGQDLIPEAIAYVLGELAFLTKATAPLISLEEKFGAYRNGYRWSASLESQPLAAVNKIELKDDGCYLITGGLGGLGLEFAAHLAELGATKIALVGRSAFPDPAQWDTWLGEHDHKDETSKKIIKLKKIQNNKVDIAIFSADLTSAVELKSVISALTRKWGNVRGVIHSAGIAGTGVMQLKTREQADKVIAPKVKGILALEQALTGQPLDFLVLFSSLFSVIGGIGQVDYSAANCFLDAYARHRRNTFGLPVVAINWGGFSEVGMAATMGFSPNQPVAVAPSEKKAQHPYLHSLEQSGDNKIIATSYLSCQQHWALREHRVAGQWAMPGTGLLEMIRAAFMDFFPDISGVSLENVYFLSLLSCAEHELVQVAVEFSPVSNGNYIFECFKTLGQQRISFVSGDIYANQAAQTQVNLSDLVAAHNLERVQFSLGQSQILTEDNFLELGPRWQNLKDVSFSNTSLLARLELDGQFIDDLNSYYWHPALLDMATGPVTGHLLTRLNLNLQGGEFLPFSYGKLECHARLPKNIYSFIEFRHFDESQKTIHFDISIYDEMGNSCLTITDFILKKVPVKLAPVGSEDAIDFMDDSTTPKEGRAIFNRILENLEQPQWIVSTQDLPALVSRIRAGIVDSLGVKVREKSIIARDEDVIAPSTPEEEILVDIFETVLGVTPISVHDNFFDLGADSVTGIQIVSHAKARGLILKPNQLFKYQTIAELAQVAATKVKADMPERAYSDLQLASLEFADIAQQWNWLGFTVPQARLDELSQRTQSLFKNYGFLCRQYTGSGKILDVDPETCQLEFIDLNHIEAVGGNLQQMIADYLSGQKGNLARVLYSPAEQRLVLAVHNVLGLDLNILSRCATLLVSPESWPDDGQQAEPAYDFEPQDAEALFYKKLEKFSAINLEQGIQSTDASILFPISKHSELEQLLLAHNLTLEELLALSAYKTSLELQGSRSGLGVNLVRTRNVSIDGKIEHHRFVVPVYIEPDPQKSIARQLSAIGAKVRELPRAGISYSLYQNELNFKPDIFISCLGSALNSAVGNCDIANCNINSGISPEYTYLALDAWMDNNNIHVRCRFNGVSCDPAIYMQVFQSVFDLILTEVIKVEAGGITADHFTDADLSDEDFSTLVDAIGEEFLVHG
jgi:phthiocerol/phenolphthiocerol synthesis type-I polyketide synthase E